MVPTPDEGEEQYENLGTDNEPIYGAYHGEHGCSPRDSFA